MRKDDKLEKILDDVCFVRPSRIRLEPGGCWYVKPCGAEYREKNEVHCDLYRIKQCPYLPKP